MTNEADDEGKRFSACLSSSKSLVFLAMSPMISDTSRFLVDLSLRMSFRALTAAACSFPDACIHVLDAAVLITALFLDDVTGMRDVRPIINESTMSAPRGRPISSRA